MTPQAASGPTRSPSHDCPRASKSARGRRRGQPQTAEPGPSPTARRIQSLIEVRTHRALAVTDGLRVTGRVSGHCCTVTVQQTPSRRPTRSTGGRRRAGRSLALRLPVALARAYNATFKCAFRENDCDHSRFVTFNVASGQRGYCHLGRFTARSHATVSQDHLYFTH